MPANPLPHTPLTANEILLDRAVRHAVYLNRLRGFEYNRAIASIERKHLARITRLAVDRLSADLARGPGAMTRRSTLARMNSIQKDLNKIGGAISRDLNKTLTANMHEVALAEASFQTSLITGTVPVHVDYARPGESMLRSIATERPMRGRFLKAWTEGVGRGTANRVGAHISSGMIEGQSIDSIVRGIRGTRALGFKDGILNATRAEVRMVTRTAVTHFSSAARDISYNQNPHLVKGVQYVATLDHRTTDICASLDGQVFKLDDGPRPPMHMNCRSTTTPVLKSWKELGINLKTAPPGTRASMNGQVSAKLNYNDWLRQQSTAVQNDVLGPTKGRLFRKGNPISKFVDENYRPMSVSQILAQEGLIG